MIQSWAGEFAQQLRVLVALTEDRGLIPSTHKVRTICNSSPRGPNTLL